MYEEPLPVPVSRLLPATMLSGPNYRVAPEASSHGMLYSFHIDSNYGVYEPQSLQMMRIRIAELQAIHRLEKLAEEPIFLRGMGKQLESTVEATGKAIKNPVKTLKELPVGFKKFAGSITASSSVGTVYGESGSPIYSDVKRDLASRLGVDPYTDNEPLQELLNKIARNQNRGQLVASLGTLVVGGGAGLALEVVEMNDEFQQQIRNKSAQQLQVENRAALIGMGVPEPAADRFLNTYGYTATNSTAITQAMVTLRNVSGITSMLEYLPPYAGPESILFGQTQVQMAAQFHRKKKKLVSVRFVSGTPVWKDDAGVSYVFSPLEHLYWNEEIDLGLSNIRRQTGTGLLEFWISGTATPTANTQLASRGVFVRENSFNVLWPSLASR